MFKKIDAYHDVDGHQLRLRVACGFCPALKYLYFLFVFVL